MAGRTSPPTDRVVAVLDHLVARSDRRFGLSELARALGMSKPTCLGILTSLVDGGYLVRDPASVTYGLGPALIAAGRAAQAGFAVGPIVRRHLENLSARYRATCTASAVVGDRITVLEATGPDVGRSVKVGQAYPFAPPVGLMYVLWDSDANLENWLHREPALPVRLDREHLRRVVAECRRTGYLVETLTEVGLKLHTVMAGVGAHDLPGEVRELLGEMVQGLGERVYLGADEAGPGTEHGVSVIAAPTFDEAGRQAMVLTLNVRRSITGADIVERGQALAAVAGAVTAEVGGFDPIR
ncbi:IclR family transcriptional regulator [Rhodococcoides yunnanense]|uniref:IclR family transcriptional regulator n=1 Tax=Rhodococcoides yunnanense TaxID=278209 RepID=UPI000933143F|nr:helix-turn-helix domain-containing protein [Rhodococcus yunnanensis]